MGMEKEPGTEAERDQEDLFAEGFLLGEDEENGGGAAPEDGDGGSVGGQGEDGGQEAEEAKPEPDGVGADPSGGPVQNFV